MDRMKPERDPFRIDLRAAKLCMELDCNTIFDASMHRHCPTCGSVEFYPLESWLNRERTQKPALRPTLGVDTAAAFKSTSRALWLGRLRGGRAEEAAVPAPLRLRSRAQRRRVG
jgi:hypothetical protein